MQTHAHFKESEARFQEIRRESKGILKSGPTMKRKTATFDEHNVLETYRSLQRGTDHRHFGADITPKFTIPVFSIPVDKGELKSKLETTYFSQSPDFGDEGNISDDEFPETYEEKVHRLVFQERRKKHYNEYHFVTMARQLIDDELESEEDFCEELMSEMSCNVSKSSEEEFSTSSESDISKGKGKKKKEKDKAKEKEKEERTSVPQTRDENNIAEPSGVNIHLRISETQPDLGEATIYLLGS